MNRDEIEDEIDFILEVMGIERDKLVHFIFPNGFEVVAEAVEDSHSYDTMVLYPVAIKREPVIDQEGNIVMSSIYSDWNSHTDDHFRLINPDLILSSSRPNQVTIYNYVVALQKKYFEIEVEEDDADFTIERPTETGDKIIDFNKYLKRK